MLIFSTDDDPKAHSEFVKWIEANQDGFFINRKSQKAMMLHSSRCGHLKPYDWANQTTNLKACSLDRKKLEHWAEIEGAQGLDVCKDCM
jgi:hypothetical protein